MMETVNQRLSKLVKAKKISQTDLATQLSVTSSSVSNWCNKQSLIPLKNIIAILELFPDVDSNWLLLGRGAMLIGDDTLSEWTKSNSDICEECFKKDGVIEELKNQMDKQSMEIKKLYIEIGKFEERLLNAKKK